MAPQVGLAVQFTEFQVTGKWDWLYYFYVFFLMSGVSRAAITS